MKKRILTGFLGLFLVLGLTACGGKKDDGGNKEPAVDETKILEDKEHDSWALHGNFKLATGEENAWNGKSNELYEASKMTATSLSDLKAASETAYTKMKAAGVKYLYKYVGAEFGTIEHNWGKKFWTGTKMMYADGSYAFKAVQLSYDAEDEVYSEDMWIPDAKKAHAQCVTDNMFIPIWQEALDEHGFSWASDQVVTGGAGVYTVFVAQYNNPSSADKAGYGFALIRTEEKTGLAYQEVVEFVPADHTFGLVGTINGWGTTADIAMTGEGNGPYAATYTFEAGAEFKVRADSAWDSDWGFGAVKTMPEGAFEDSSGNIKVVTAGSYQVSISFVAGEGSITISAVA